MVTAPSGQIYPTYRPGILHDARADTGKRGGLGNRDGLIKGQICPFFSWWPPLHEIRHPGREHGPLAMANDQEVGGKSDEVSGTVRDRLESKVRHQKLLPSSARTRLNSPKKLPLCRCTAPAAVPRTGKRRLSDPGASLKRLDLLGIFHEGSDPAHHSMPIRPRGPAPET